MVSSINVFTDSSLLIEYIVNDFAPACSAEGITLISNLEEARQLMP